MKLDIFIIDDDLVSQFATRYCIEQFGDSFDVSTCSSAEEGLERCATWIEEYGKLPDIIFLDLIMGEMDGWEFLEHLEKFSNGVKMPKVYVLSSFVNSKDREKAKKNPVIEGYFDKPLAKTSLAKVFQKAS
ncbi:response regulator [Flavobacterium sp. ASW18X]|uniref:response regulator n=1 Tax=Flavobacterium sp. ASW18X TaxID=2572595 RepID=UPI0010AE2FA8|nr:response regulator [Flavobacterium sp. ASW18X]TKD66994.1 response regulator [Flavobacterium sp. ASW18X]